MGQSAVEWLIEQLFELRNPTLNQIEIIKQAKEIQKQQIIECGNSCAIKQVIHSDMIDQMTRQEVMEYTHKDSSTFGEQYYNETFENK